MKHLRIMFLIVLMSITMTAVFADQTDFPIDVHLYISSLDRAEGPVIVDNFYILSFQNSRAPRYVAVAFAGEFYRELHLFTKNQQGIYTYAFPVPSTGNEITYRLVIDGLWVQDPFNPQKKRDVMGISLSVLDIPKNANPVPVNPRILDNQYVEFTILGTPGKVIFIAGDFNSWDPFMNRLTETSPGIYSIKLRIPQGRHYYYYISEGNRILDPFNINRTSDREGFEFSTFTLPSSVAMK